MQHNLKLISKTLLVHLPENESFSLEQFVRLQEQYIAEQSEFIDVKNKEVEKASNDVIQACAPTSLSLVQTSPGPGRRVGMRCGARIRQQRKWGQTALETVFPRC